MPNVVVTPECPANGFLWTAGPAWSVRPRAIRARRHLLPRTRRRRRPRRLRPPPASPHPPLPRRRRPRTPRPRPPGSRRRRATRRRRWSARRARRQARADPPGRQARGARQARDGKEPQGDPPRGDSVAETGRDQRVGRPAWADLHAARGRGPGSRRAARPLSDPAVPAPDLPGGGGRVRRAVAGAGRDQRDRDRLRPQPQRLQRRRAGLDAVHAAVVEGLRRGRQRRRAQGPLQPRRRDLRRRALPEGRGGQGRHPPGDLRLQPRRLVRPVGDAAGQAGPPAAARPRGRAHGPHRGSLPGGRPRHLREEGRRARRASRSTPARGRRSSRSTTAWSRRSASRRSSAASCASRTSTATPTPTRTSARSAPATPRRARSRWRSWRARRRPTTRRSRRTRSRPARRPRAARPPARAAERERDDHRAGQEGAAIRPPGAPRGLPRGRRAPARPGRRGAARRRAGHAVPDRRLSAAAGATCCCARYVRAPRSWPAPSSPTPAASR